MNQIEAKPLSNVDIINKLNGKTNIVMYPDLARVRKVEDILVNDSVVILYETRPNVGHWVCILKREDTIEFFDSYGIFPDKEKKYINKEYLKESGQENNNLIRLLLEAGKRYRIEYNNYRLQVKSGDVATCGRHVISRILLKNLSIEQFNKFMRGFKQYGLTPDDVATIISEYII